VGESYITDTYTKVNIFKVIGFERFEIKKTKFGSFFTKFTN
jgi:hypothetical protein